MSGYVDLVEICDYLLRTIKGHETDKWMQTTVQTESHQQPPKSTLPYLPLPPLSWLVLEVVPSWVCQPWKVVGLGVWLGQRCQRKTFVDPLKATDLQQNLSVGQLMQWVVPWKHLLPDNNSLGGRPLPYFGSSGTLTNGHLNVTTHNLLLTWLLSWKRHIFFAAVLRMFQCKSKKMTQKTKLHLCTIVRHVRNINLYLYMMKLYENWMQMV